MAAQEKKTKAGGDEEANHPPRDVEEGRGAGDHAGDDRRARPPHLPIRRRRCRVQRCMSAANEAVEPLVEAGPLCDEHREKLIAGHDWELQGSEQSATGTSEPTILMGESLQALNEYILLN